MMTSAIQMHIRLNGPNWAGLAILKPSHSAGLTHPITSLSITRPGGGGGGGGRGDEENPSQTMVARIWLASFLCRKKPSPRALTAGWCSPLGYLTPSPSPGVLTADPCSPLGYVRPRPSPRLLTADCSSPLGCLTPRSGEDGERISQKLHWMRYWLSVGAQPSNYMQLITGSPLNLEGITPVDDSRCGAEESNTCDEVVPGIPYGCSNAPKGYDTSAGRIINRSSGPGALLLHRRSRSSSTSLGRTSSRHLSSNSPGPDNQLFDKTNADFRVVQGNNFSLLGQIDADVEEAECEFTEAAVKERYLKHVGPQLTSRGLVLPEKLRHNTTAFVHFRTKDITGHRPKYMSVLDVMGHEKRMKDDEWQYFLKDMIKTRIYVVENWGSSLCHVVSLTYDRAVISPDDVTGVEFYKAECDASYCAKKQQADLSFLISKGSKIMHCQVYYEVPCSSSLVAECYAAAACLMKAKELGIKNLSISMDSKDSFGVLSGERNVKPGDPHLGVCMMLRKHQNALERVVPVWKERELNQLADDLVTLDKRTVLDPKFPGRAIERWRHLRDGYPVFRFKQKNEVESVIKGFVDNQSYGTAASNTVRLEVEGVEKFDCLIGLLDGFQPDDMYVSIYEFAKKPQDFQSKFKELFDGLRREVVGEVSQSSASVRRLRI